MGGGVKSKIKFQITFSNKPGAIPVCKQKAPNPRGLSKSQGESFSLSLHNASILNSIQMYKVKPQRHFAFQYQPQLYQSPDTAHISHPGHHQTRYHRS